MSTLVDVRLFIHSRCCGSHWELVVRNDGKADLLCEKCRKPCFAVDLIPALTDLEKRAERGELSCEKAEHD